MNSNRFQRKYAHWLCGFGVEQEHDVLAPRSAIVRGDNDTPQIAHQRRPHTQAPAPSPSDLAAENARLRRENDHLRMERDILKKAALIFGAASR